MYIIKRRRNKLKNKFSHHKNFSNKLLNSNHFLKKIITVLIYTPPLPPLLGGSSFEKKKKGKKEKINMKLNVITTFNACINNVNFNDFDSFNATYEMLEIIENAYEIEINDKNFTELIERMIKDYKKMINDYDVRYDAYSVLLNFINELADENLLTKKSFDSDNFISKYKKLDDVLISKVARKFELMYFDSLKNIIESHKRLL
jgi:hypothetical protein